MVDRATKTISVATTSKPIRSLSPSTSRLLGIIGEIEGILIKIFKNHYSISKRISKKLNPSILPTTRGENEAKITFSLATPPRPPLRTASSRAPLQTRASNSLIAEKNKQAHFKKHSQIFSPARTPPPTERPLARTTTSANGSTNATSARNCRRRTTSCTITR